MSPRRQQGVSLVEIMIALALGLLLTAVVTQIYIAHKQTYRLTDASGRLQENARFAIDILTRDIRMAGYEGCGGKARSTVNTLTDTSSFLYDFGTPIQGFEATSTSSWTPTVDSNITSPLGGSDIVTIRGVFGSEVSITGSSDLGNCNTADLIVASATGFGPGDIVIAGNCANAAIFQITSFTAGSSTGTIGHTTGDGTPGNATANLGACYASNGELAKITTRAFYIRNNSARIPSLYREDSSGSALELIEGVEELQILYGVDTDATVDNSANKFVRANDVTNWDRVVSVRINLLLRSLQDNIVITPQTYTFNGATVDPADRYLRRVFTTTIGLRNRLP